MPQLYCIGDIHGCAHTLSDLLSEVPLAKDDQLLFVGDYIDRGPDSKGVIDQILDLEKKGFGVITLMGNHEAMFIETTEEDRIYECWTEDFGGEATLRSFNVDTFQELPDAYRLFFYQLKLHVRLAGHVFVHAGLDFSAADIFSNIDAMLWTRSMVVDQKKLGRNRIVHGHTPQPFSTTRQQLQQLHTQRVINVDTGCVFRNHDQLGTLTALDVMGGRLYHVPNRRD